MEIWLTNDQAKLKAINVITSIQGNHILTISEEEAARTDKQRKYQWGWVYRQIEMKLAESGRCINMADGGTHPWTKDLLHELFKEKFLISDVIEFTNGKKLKTYHSSAKLPKKRNQPSGKPSFSEFLDMVKNFCHDFWQITIPEPQDGDWLDIYNEVYIK